MTLALLADNDDLQTRVNFIKANLVAPQSPCHDFVVLLQMMELNLTS